MFLSLVYMKCVLIRGYVEIPIVYTRYSIPLLFRYAAYLVVLNKLLPHPDSLEIPMFFGE